LIFAALAAALLAALALGAASAIAATPAPHLTIHMLPMPTRFSSADTAECLAHTGGSTFEAPCDSYFLTVTNTGDAPTTGPITITDALPPGVSLLTAPERANLALYRWFESATTELGSEEGTLGGQLYPGSTLCNPEAVPVSCEFTEPLPPDQRLNMEVLTTVQPNAQAAPTTATVSEAGVPVASITANDSISSTPPLFGPSALASAVTSPDGSPDVQAGDHPYEFTTSIDLNSKMGFTPESKLLPTTVGGVRDVVVDLPLGFLGSAQATPKCTWAQLTAFPQSCPFDTMLGTITSLPAVQTAASAAVFNMVPEKGVAAELGFHDLLYNTHVIDASVAPTPSGYVLRATAREIPDVDLTNITTTLFGDPAEKTGVGRASAQFTNPSDCSGGPLATSVHMDSWEHPGSFNSDGTPNLEGPGWASMTSESPPVTGCDALRFSPEAFTVKPETATADSPTGLNFELKLPQPEQPGTLATPPLRDAAVALPAGLSVDPSAANGLQACSLTQVGMSASGVPDAAPPACPEASKIGSVEVVSPLLSSTVHGSVYLAAENENPFHSLLAGYIVIDDELTGTIVKIPGELKTNETTGQITGVFNNNPQLPFSDLKLHFFGGPRGDLATPEGCGTYTTTSDLKPWSAPESGPDATPSDSFAINSGCVSGFSPAFSAGTASSQAGTFSPFTLALSRNDNEEAPAGLTVSMPQGLLGKIAGVGECSDAQLAAAASHSGAGEQASPSCPSSSQLGTVQTASGPGPNPFVVGGKAYLTGPYKGAPFGIAVIVPALAGPFDLGTVVIRAALYIDPSDAHVSAVSDPFPTILQGIPLRIKSVRITLDRPEFTFNPTSCEQKAITATVTSTGGAHAPVSSRFQAAGCQGMPFVPKLTASASGKASKANGTSFAVTVTSAGLGQEDIAKVDLTLPKALPSRLTTIQKACPAATFEANPASCDEGSVIGMATIHTPLLNSPLSGPAYLVSHAAASFPDVEFVLQGEGVKLLLDGKTDIKKGITYSRFDSTPDAPFTRFEAVLPAGPHSALTTNVPESQHYSLCKANLAMPTEITGQNGAVIKQTTKIAATGCKGVRAFKASRSQLLAKALKACRKKRNRGRRLACERQARRRYGAHSARKGRRRG